MNILKKSIAFLSLTAITISASANTGLRLNRTALRPTLRLNKCATLERAAFSGELRGRRLAVTKRKFFNCMKGSSKIKQFENTAFRLSAEDKELLQRIAQKKIRSARDIDSQTMEEMRNLSPRVTQLMKQWERLSPNERATYKDFSQVNHAASWVVAAAVVAIYAVEKGFEYYGNTAVDHIVYPSINRDRLLDY